MTLDEILKEIKEAKSIVILTHESPDGDAIGSSLAMKFILEKLEKKQMSLLKNILECFNFCQVQMK